jgi:hypothetical protein
MYIKITHMPIWNESHSELNEKLMQLIGVNGDDSGMENSSQL